MHFIPFLILLRLQIINPIAHKFHSFLSLPRHCCQMGRPPCCDKSNVKRGLWTPEEDAKILAYVSNHGVGNWTLVPKKAGLNRCGKSCRLRWTNYLRPDLRHDSFSAEEEELIINLHQAIGSRWSLIAKRLPGRTDNDVKNYWNTKLRKKLMTKGIDPITHKPFSQIFYDYGNISGLPNPASQAGSFNRNFKPELSTPPISAFPNQNPINSLPANLHFQPLTQESIQQHLLDEVSSSCSSSSACNVTMLNSPDHSSFAWSQFLLHDTFLQRDPQNLNYDRKKAYKASPIPEIEQGFRGVGEETNFTALNSRSPSPTLTQSKQASSAVNSFIDTILDRDSEIRAVFPEILEEYFD